MNDADRFVAEARPRWEALEAMLLGGALRTGRDWEAFSSLYRSVCADLARARGDDAAADVQAYLDDLAGRAHHRMYATRRRVSGGLATMLTVALPRQVRASWRWVLAAAILFYGPWLVCGVGAFLSEPFALSLQDRAALDGAASMYAEAPDDRSIADAATMAGFYVWNNVGIAFRCFATGVLGGLGSVFFLVFNGVSIGVTFGHLARVGSGGNLLSFVAGHAPWELTGIVISGAAGLRMGWALIETHGATRVDSLRAASPEVFRLVATAAVMLLIAAAIEGFWSASPVPFPLKMAFAVVQVVLVTSWLVLGGRGRA